MNREQLQTLIVEPLYNRMKNGMSGVDAFMMCVAHESKGGEYISQVGSGIAKGIIQMEDATHDSVWANGDSIWDNAVNLGLISRVDWDKRIKPSADRLIYDLQYNAFMFRQFMFMQPGKLPNDKRELAKYLKKHYNTYLGKATDIDYLYDDIKWR